MAGKSLLGAQNLLKIQIILWWLSEDTNINCD